jgi:hypothetical protein
MAHHFGADLHEFFPQAGQRPLFDRLRPMALQAPSKPENAFTALT